MPMDVTPFVKRRAALAARMERGVAVIPTAPERARNRDAHYPYRFDSYFYYLTGFTEPDAMLVVVAGDAPQSILFCREKDEEREIWDGFATVPRRRAKRSDSTAPTPSPASTSACPT